MVNVERTLVRSFFYSMITMRASLELAAAKLKWEAKKCNNTQDYTDLAFSFFNSFPFKQWRIRPAQVKEEIVELLTIMAKNRPKTILEIGTAKGGTLFLFTRVSSSSATLISVDLPSGYPKWRIPLYKSFATHRQKIFLIRRDSHAYATLATVKKFLGGRELDFLFIDGDHTYNGVKNDFEMYSRLVGKRGIIVLHDICIPRKRKIWWGVNKFWNEIKHRYENIEILKWGLKQPGGGIGILFT